MSLGDLLQTLEHDAATEARALLDAATVRAQERTAASARARTEQLTQARRDVREACEAAAETELATVQHAARARTLTARAAMLERVREAVRVLLPSVVDRVMPVLTARAVACAGDEPTTVRTVPTGVIIELANGTQIVATLDALFERESARLDASLLARLAKETVS